MTKFDSLKFQSKNTESPKAPVESHHFREDTVDTHLRYPSELSSQSCKGFCEKSRTILQHDFSSRNTLKGCSSHHWKKSTLLTST